MDIECPTCGEPWDSYHMRHDEAHEWGLSSIELREFLETGRFTGPDDRVRKAAEAAGWEFATNSVFSFTRCPCCAKHTPLRDALARKEKTAVLAELLEGDEDGLISMLAA
jgi:predicted RNA-binding Zn-ribbon protein involved in translation (DUF1610 family)